ncbi:hypothetical protein [Streptomyces sp. Je 1-369]|uniref:hypothetical protein n=1 Tax=Streptomyces sp. Je 1-369 TaxID=2966192 RepID=UPI0022860A11|nr:hypothetical protein [Streptomyces sp. Je 1-369]WAL93622.1 hypothetical protein NOO62_03425 [Streptomyces sp. Je 1-369]
MPPVPPQPPPPPPSGPPPGGGGFGPPPGGGYGPPPGNGGWQPPPPPGGPPGRRNGLFVLLAVIVALGAVAAVVLLTTGDDGDGKKEPVESGSSTGRDPTPSLSIPSEVPDELPTGLPSDVPSLPTDFPTLPTEFPSDLDSVVPSPADDPVPYYLLRRGDCFNVDSSRPGQAAKRSCNEPHDAEVVEFAELKGSYGTDAALKKAAAALCERPLERKARSQPSGTVRGTLVQYPDATGYKVGIDNVACSLAGDSGSGKHKLTKPLS